MSSEEKEIDDGGAAFPQTRMASGEWPFDGHGMGGMTLRDYFAANMPDLFSEWNFHQRHEALGITQDEWMQDTIGNAARFEAHVRYRYADAMLVERAGGVREGDAQTGPPDPPKTGRPVWEEAEADLTLAGDTPWVWATCGTCEERVSVPIRVILDDHAAEEREKDGQR